MKERDIVTKRKQFYDFCEHCEKEIKGLSESQFEHNMSKHLGFCQDQRGRLEELKEAEEPSDGTYESDVYEQLKEMNRRMRENT